MLHGMLTALLRGLAVVLGVVTLTFFLLHLAPGDPVRRLLGPAAEPAQIEAPTLACGEDLCGLQEQKRMEEAKAAGEPTPVVC